MSPGSILLAVVFACGGLLPVLYGLTHGRHGRPGDLLSRAGFANSSQDDSDDDDPSRVDTIYLGGPNEAPVPARPGARPSSVHPFVVVRLPSSGDQVGQIPDSAAGHLLYDWLAIFNGPDPAAFARALPTADGAAAGAAQRELRQQTGGFTLVSAREVQPGLLVFRLRDQTPAATEVLGTLEVRPGSSPATIASFSLRAVDPPQLKAP